MSFGRLGSLGRGFGRLGGGGNRTSAPIIPGVITASPGSFTETGIDAGFAWNRTITQSTGTFNLTGVDATLTGPGFTPTSTESGNFLARATGITDATDKTRYDALITGLVTDGIFAKLDALYIFAAPDSTTAKLNLIQNLYNGATSLSFTAYQGFTGDGTNVFTTGFIPSSASAWTTSSASFGVYNRTSNTSENTQFMGASHGNDTIIYAQPSGGAKMSAVLGVFALATVNVSNSQGFWQAVRTSSSDVGFSRNGAAPTVNSSAGGAGLVDVQLYVFGVNNNGSAGGQTSDQFSAAYIGRAMTNTDIANFSSRINTFMTAYSINVY